MAKRKSKKVSGLQIRRFPDGNEISPVIFTDCKFFGNTAECVDVRFRTVEELDVLIEALVHLREFPSDGYNHVHLQDGPRYKNKRGTAAGTEVTFWHPSARRDAIDKSCVASAARFRQSVVDARSNSTD